MRIRAVRIRNPAHLSINRSISIYLSRYPSTNKLINYLINLSHLVEYNSPLLLEHGLIVLKGQPVLFFLSPPPLLLLFVRAALFSLLFARFYRATPFRPYLQEYAFSALRWEFLKENKKVRKQELDQESDKEKKKKLSFFLNHFLGRVFVFFLVFFFSWSSSFFLFILFSFINSQLRLLKDVVILSSRQSLVRAIK